MGTHPARSSTTAPSRSPRNFFGDAWRRFRPAAISTLGCITRVTAPRLETAAPATRLRSTRSRFSLQLGPRKGSPGRGVEELKRRVRNIASQVWAPVQKNDHVEVSVFGRRLDDELEQRNCQDDAIAPHRPVAAAPGRPTPVGRLGWEDRRPAEHRNQAGQRRQGRSMANGPRNCR